MAKILAIKQIEIWIMTVIVVEVQVMKVSAATSSILKHREGMAI